MISDNPTISRRAFSLKVCEWFDWKSPNGKYKDMSCRVALLKLHQKGLINLPEPRILSHYKTQELKRASYIEGIESLICNLEELGKIELVRIDSGRTDNSKTWNALMNAYHYLGSGPLCGSQIRYLIKSANHGWLGGLSFSAAAWRVEGRDRWIGWSEEARNEHLSRVVCNSRFLILPQVQVPNLASHVLSLASQQLGKNWIERYGIMPVLLETFVERERFQGTCYRAANWQYVGMTRGRGRQDSGRTSSLPVKEIYVYPLQKDAREILCSTVSNSVKLDISQEVSVQDWTEEEFGRADLGDSRLTKRLKSIVSDFYARPQCSIPQACQSRAKTKATYRFLENPAMTMDKVLQSHYETTLDRVRREKIVLSVQDTSTLNYTAHPAAQNLGPIGYSLEKGIGLILHDTMSFTSQGIPLGLLDVQCWARDAKDFGKKRRRRELPIEQKESNKWLTSFRKTVQAQRQCPKTTLVSVGDREADIYELFELALGEKSISGKPELLIRASYNRRLGDDQGYLWERVTQQAVSGIQEIRVPRSGSRPARMAKLEIRFAQVTLKSPKQYTKTGPGLNVWAVLVQEVDFLEDVKEPLEWMLLTTLAVTTFEQAVEKIDWYKVRWGIEVYHRTLKSGCKIEERRLGTADSIETCLGIDMVVAWRIVYLTRLGRDTPNVPCTVYFEEAEWKALNVYITKNPLPPEHPPTLREATRMVASLGGFLGRKSDGEPGTESIWIGLQRLDDMTGMWKIMINRHVPHLKKRIVSSNYDYG